MFASLIRPIALLFCMASTPALAIDHNDIDRPPLNQYGAVDSEAKVPMALQVEPPPVGFKQPSILVESIEWPDLVPKEPSIAANSYILISGKTGHVLAAQDPHQRFAPASMTKLMSLYIIQKELRAGHIRLDDTVTVPKVAWATKGSTAFLKPGETLSVESLIKAISVVSGNDATVALAVHIAGTEQAFVSMMNHQAKQFEMTNTHFNNVTGLPSPKHYSSAYDLSVLGRHIINDFPEYLSWFVEKEYTHNGITQANFNKLLTQYKHAIGLKTGASSASGYSLVSAAKQPETNDTLIAVVMGAKSKGLSASHSQALLTYGFRFFETNELYAKDEAINHPKVYMGQKTNIPVGIAQALTLTHPRVESHHLRAELHIDSTIVAPIQKGEQLGILNIMLQDKMLTQVPIVALEADDRGSLWRQFKDRIALLFS